MLAEIANGVYSLAVGAKELPFSFYAKETEVCHFRYSICGTETDIFLCLCSPVLGGGGIEEKAKDEAFPGGKDGEREVDVRVIGRGKR